MDRYIPLERVGKGTYGVVYKARDKRPQEHKDRDGKDLKDKNDAIVALKTIELDADEGIPSTAVREIALLKFLRHPNVVTLYDVIHMADKLTMVFEFLELDLKKYLDACGTTGLELITVKSLLFQLLQGIAYCHKQRVLHRDLKPANLLLNRSGVLKLADFGLARTFAMDVSSLKHEVITLWYRGPELLLGSTKYCTEVDIWSIGCIFAEMINGSPLFPGASDAKQLETIYNRLGTPDPSIWPGITQLPLYNETAMATFVAPQQLESLVPRLRNDPDGLDLLGRMLQYDPARRITAEEALHHPFFNELKRRPRRSSAASQAQAQQQYTQQQQQQQQMQQQMHAVPAHGEGMAAYSEATQL